MISEQKIKVSFYRNLKILYAIAATFISGTMLFLAFPSYDFSLSAWFAFVPLFLLLSKSKPSSGFFILFLFGVVFYTGVFIWMFDLPNYMVLHHAILGIYLCPLLGIFGWLFCFIIKRRDFTSALLAAPFLWVIQEYVRSNLSFLSLPWGLLGHSQYQSPMVIQSASIAGVYGVSFLIVLVNSALTVLIYSLFIRLNILKPEDKYQFSYRGRNILLGISAVFFISALVYGHMVISNQINGNKIKISIVQANIEQSKKWDKKYAATIMQIYSDLTQKASADQPDLIVWPEAATPKAVHRDRKIFNTVKNLASVTNTPILLGSSQLAKFKVNELKKNAKYLNSAFLIHPGDGNGITQKYNKIRLLPFSEYLPYKEKIPWSYLRIPDVDNYLPGKKYTVFELTGFRFGVTICWENIFPGIVREFVNNGAQFLINITNEAWFGETAAPYQFLAMSVFRAVENHRYLVRCANTGVSCIIDPQGRILDKVKDNRGRAIFVRGNLTGSVTPFKDRTFFNRYGDWLVWLSLIVSLMFLVLTFMKKKPSLK